MVEGRNDGHTLGLGLLEGGGLFVADRNILENECDASSPPEVVVLYDLASGLPLSII